MKTLYLVRHAKSSWDSPRLRDIDRPLNKRGLRDAPLMGKLLAELVGERGGSPQVILTSPAKRAAVTAGAFAEALGIPMAKVHRTEKMYDAGAETLREVIFEIDDGVESAILVGHNPGMTQLAGSLSPAPITHMPTCSIVALQYPVDSWRLVRPGLGTLIFFEIPKNHIG